MYTFPDKIDLESSFLFDSSLVTKRIWAALPKSAKTVYPVIGAFTNNRGYSYPSELTIAILCGRTEKTVRQAIKELQKLTLFTVSSYITEKGRKAKKFHIAFPEDEINSFPFHRCLLEKGLWQHLSPTAQSLYPVMRHFSYFDQKTFTNYNDNPEEQIEPDQDSRDYAYCQAAPEKLASFAGISRQVLYRTLQDLQACSLIEPLDKDPGGHVFLWKVYFKTDSWFQRPQLNKKVMERYGSRKK